MGYAGGATGPRFPPSRRRVDRRRLDLARYADFAYRLRMAAEVDADGEPLYDREVAAVLGLEDLAELARAELPPSRRS